MGFFDVFSIVTQGSLKVLGSFKAIAYVDRNAEGALMHFAETLARNRGLPLSVFPTITDAEAWLQQNAPPEM